jgi:hypothetical protein
MIDNLQLRIYRAGPWQDAVECHLIAKLGGGIYEVGGPVPMERQEEPAIQPTPAFYLTDDACHTLAQQLWDLGYRPKSETSGALAATRAHLDDLQKISERLLDKVLGGE